MFVFCCDFKDHYYGKRGTELYSLQDATIAQTYAILACNKEGLSEAFRCVITSRILLGGQFCGVGGEQHSQHPQSPSPHRSSPLRLQRGRAAPRAFASRCGRDLYVLLWCFLIILDYL